MCASQCRRASPAGKLTALASGMYPYLRPRNRQLQLTISRYRPVTLMTIWWAAAGSSMIAMTTG
jgi:hypothetical protein